jgi:hypothetical protein
MTNLNSGRTHLKVKPLLQCHVLLTGLLPELIPPGLDLPGLARLLALTGKPLLDDVGSETWLCRRFGLAACNAAPFSALGEGLQLPENTAWLRVDPVHLQLMRDRLIVADAQLTDLSEEDAVALLDTLNRHFAVDDIALEAPVPHRWYVRLPALPLISTTPAAEAVGRDVDSLLPQGDAAMAWHRWVNEAQMLLHDHPVNQAREARGQKTVNSLWPWGGGALSSLSGAFFDHVTANDPLARGLGMQAGAAVQSLPEDFRTYSPQGNALIVLDSLNSSALRQHPELWLQALQRLDQDWLQPFAAAVSAGQVHALNLHLANFRQIRSFAVERWRRWHFWRRPQSLETYLHG